MEDITKKFEEIFKDDLEFIQNLQQQEEDEAEPTFIDHTIIYALALSSYTVLADKLSSFVKESLDSKKNVDEVTTTLSDTMKIINYYDLIKKEINKLISETIKLSNSKNHFWRDCSIEVYVNYYEKLKDIYLEKYPEASEVDFIKFELQYLKHSINEIINVVYKDIVGVDYLSMVEYKRHLNLENIEYFSFTRYKKIDFLKNKLNQLGYHLEEIFLDGKSQFIFKEINNFKREHNTSLQLKGIPSFNVKQRYELFKRLGFENEIHKLDSKQMGKYNVLAILMGISPDNAKQLINNTYQTITERDLEELNNYLENQLITIKG